MIWMSFTSFLLLNQLPDLSETKASSIIQRVATFAMIVNAIHNGFYQHIIIKGKKSSFDSCLWKFLFFLYVADNKANQNGAEGFLKNMMKWSNKEAASDNLFLTNRNGRLSQVSIHDVLYQLIREWRIRGRKNRDGPIFPSTCFTAWFIGPNYDDLMKWAY